MASPISALTSNTNSSTSTSASTGLDGAPPSQEMFLQLLVAQLQNQDPLNPTDSTQFVSQLAQFSELEQVIAIRGDIEASQSSAASQVSTSGTQTDSAGQVNSTTTN